MKCLFNTNLQTQSNCLMSDLLDVEKSLRWETHLSLHINNVSVF